MIRSFDERLLAKSLTACLGSQELLENAEEHKKGRLIEPERPGERGLECNWGFLPSN